MKRVYFAPGAYADFVIAGPDDDAGYVTIYLPHHSASLEVRVPTCEGEPVAFNGHPAVYTDEISDKVVAMQDDQTGSQETFETTDHMETPTGP